MVLQPRSQSQESEDCNWKGIYLYIFKTAPTRNISFKLSRPRQFLEKFMKILEWSTLQEINQAPTPYSMLQHIGRVATPKLVPRHCLRYLQTTLIMGEGGLVSEFM